MTLHWIPVGAGGHVVRHTSGWFERAAARREHRRPLRLVHAALTLVLGERTYAVEMAPAWGAGAGGAGVVATGPVGSRALGRSRLWRYEVRCTPDRPVPDVALQVGEGRVLTRDPRAVGALRAVVGDVPPLVWGRDQLGCGDMWNSNSLISWALAEVGLSDAAGPVPSGCGAPGWRAGLVLAQRRRGLEPQDGG